MVLGKPKYGAIKILAGINDHDQLRWLRTQQFSPRQKDEKDLANSKGWFKYKEIKDQYFKLEKSDWNSTETLPFLEKEGYIERDKRLLRIGRSSTTSTNPVCRLRQDDQAVEKVLTIFLEYGEAIKLFTSDYWTALPRSVRNRFTDSLLNTALGKGSINKIREHNALVNDSYSISLSEAVIGYNPNWDWLDGDKIRGDFEQVARAVGIRCGSIELCYYLIHNSVVSVMFREIREHGEVKSKHLPELAEQSYEIVAAARAGPKILRAVSNPRVAADVMEMLGKHPGGSEYIEQQIAAGTHPTEIDIPDEMKGDFMEVSDRITKKFYGNKSSKRRKRRKRKQEGVRHK